MPTIESGRSFKLVFYVEDAATKEVVVEKSQAYLVFSEDDLKAASFATVSWKKITNLHGEELSPPTAKEIESLATLSTVNKLSQMIDGVGVVIAKFIQPKILEKLGIIHAHN